MCQIARYTIDNYPYCRNICRNIRNQIDGGDFAFSSSPRLIFNIYIMKMGSKSGFEIPIPLGITPSSVFQYIGIHIQYIYNCTSKISKFCRSVPRSIIYFERSRPSPSSSMNFSRWFLAFSLSQSLGTLRLLPSSCSLIGQFRRK